MPKRREKGLCSELNRHGTRVWYYREGQGPRARIHGEFGSPEFNAALKVARGYGPAPVADKTMLSHTDPNSFGWLVDQFLASPFHLQKEEATRKARRNVLKRIVEKGIGSTPYRDLTDDDIRTLRNNIATEHDKVPLELVGKEVDGVTLGKAAMANGAVAILRRLFYWAIEIKKLPLRRNPCLGVTALEYTGGTNYVWTDADITRFEEAYPIGTRERLAFALMLYTGQRSGDIVRMGRQHIRDGWLTIMARKTRKHKSSDAAQVPVLDVLAETIAASPTGDLTFLVSDEGTPLSVSHFGTWFRAACDKVGLPECTPHGLRHAGATRLASRGADVGTFQCIYGWSLPMIEHYTRKANRRRSAAKDIHLLNHAA